MRSVNLDIVNGKWYDSKVDSDIKYLIKPFPFTSSLFDLATDTVDIQTNRLSQMKLLFFECLIDWKGFTGKNSEPLECNTHNKDIIFNNMADIVLDVVNIASSNDNTLSLELKN
jgi:hypothetical protein